MMGFFRLLLLTFLRNAIIGINWVSEIVYGCFFGLSKSFWFILRISVIISSVIRITPSNEKSIDQI